MKVKVFVVLISFFTIGLSQQCFSGIGNWSKPEKEEDKSRKPGIRRPSPTSAEKKEQTSIVINIGPGTSKEQMQTILKSIQDATNQYVSPTTGLAQLLIDEPGPSQEVISPTTIAPVSISLSAQQEGLHHEERHLVQQRPEEERKKREEEEEYQRLEIGRLRLEKERLLLEVERLRLEEERKKKEEHSKEEQKPIQETTVSATPIASAIEQDIEKKAVGFILPKGFPIVVTDTYKSLTVPQLCKIWVYQGLSSATHPDLIDLHYSETLKDDTQLKKAMKWVKYSINQWAKKYNLQEQASLILSSLESNMQSISPHFVKFGIKQQENKCKLLISFPGGNVVFMKVPGE